MTVVSDAICRDSYGQSEIADSMICVEGAVFFCIYLFSALVWFLLLFYLFVCCI